MARNHQIVTVLYVTNPMCAWCYGFTGVVRRLAAIWRGRLQVQVLLGDYQAYTSDALTQDDKQQLAISWHRVQKRTNLPFNYLFFTRDNFIYRTEPVCRALLCVRLLRPVLVLEVLRAFHSAFYAEGTNITNLHELVRIVKLFGIKENLFLTLYESDEITEQLQDEFERADDMGATSFPSLFLQTSHGSELICQGFCAISEIEKKLLRIVALNS